MATPRRPRQIPSPPQRRRRHPQATRPKPSPPAEREKVEAFVEKIDLTNAAGVLSFGVGAQKKVSDFSERALDGVRNNDLGEIGNDISSLIVTLKDFDPDKQEKSGPLAIFHKAKNNLEALRTRYTAVEKNVREISATLEVTSARCSRTSRRSTSSTRSTRRTSRSSRCTWSPARRSSSRYAQTS